MTATITHPTIGPNATRAGAIALYNRLVDLAWCDRDRDGGITIDHIDSLPNTRSPTGVVHWEGRQYIVSVQPMPGVTHRDRKPVDHDPDRDDPEVMAMRERRRRDTLDAPDDLPY